MGDELRLRPAELEWRDVEGEVIALDVGAAEYLTANPAGRALWLQLSEGATREQLAAALVERFGIDAERADVDVEAFLTALRERGLLDG